MIYNTLNMSNTHLTDKKSPGKPIKRTNARKPGGPSKKAHQLPRLNTKTKDFIELLHKDKKLTQTEAYLRTHPTTDRTLAAINASRLLKTANVVLYKQSMLNQSVKNVYELANNATNEGVRLSANLAIQNREKGLPVATTISQTTGIQFNIDLTGQGQVTE